MIDLLSESIKALEDMRDCMNKNQCYACNHEFIQSQGDFASNILTHCIEVLKMQPQIVRCKDCKHFDKSFSYCATRGYCDISSIRHEDDWFCADGERRTVK